MTGWASIDAALTALGLHFGAATPGQTIGGSHAAGSEHYLGLARDYGTADSDAAGIAQALVPYATGPGAPIDELFFSPLGIFYKNGAPITPDAGLRQEHYSHVHVGIRPGVDLAAAIAGGAAALAGIGGGGGLGSSLLAPIGHIVLEMLFVAGGVGLVALGALRAVHKGAAA